MARDIDELAERMSALLRDARLVNLHAQAHARSILAQLGTPADSYPRFRTDLDERAQYMAQMCIVHGLQLVGYPVHQELGRLLLSRGAEQLEFLAASTNRRLSRSDELLKAAIAYHVAGFHARAYLLMARLPPGHVGDDPFIASLLALMRRDLRLLATQVVEALATHNRSDRSLAGQLENGTLDCDDVTALAGQTGLLRALGLYVEFLKSGHYQFLQTALSMCRECALLGQDAGNVSLWWWGLATERLLADLGDSSLWTCVAGLVPATPWGDPLVPYIEHGLSATPSIVSLWPSQRAALPLLRHPEMPSFCVRMPTSAGKTRIAELAIVRSLLRNHGTPDGKCLYIAPFRSLAVEVEQSLSRGLRPLGLNVSEVYGGYELTAADEYLIAETHVLVATPEKVDAILRLAPESLDDVRLVVVDEGHITGNPSVRGLRAELLINRLLRKFPREQCRHVFISAVLPNPHEFAQWIARDPEMVAQSEWRPSRLIFGECQWDGSVAGLSFSHEASVPLEHEVFLRRFVEQQSVRGLQSVRRRRNPFPSDAGEAYAAAVIRFATYGATLAFVPQARQVMSTARNLVLAIQIAREASARDGIAMSLPAPNLDSSLMQECMEVIEEEFGPGSEMAVLIQAGVGVHHGSMPGRVRVAIERLLRAGEMRIVVATTTLGQGVNLPVRTVLIRGLLLGHNDIVSPIDVWNIAGRAGRAMAECEGYVVFFNDVTRASHIVRSQRRAMRSIIDRTAIEDVIGSMHKLLRLLHDKWNQDTPSMSFEELCGRVAEDDVTWIESPRDRVAISRQLSGLDQQLLALAVEGKFGPADADKLQLALRESLLFAQLGAHPLPDISEERAVRLVSARLRGVFHRVPTPMRRQQFYRMGLGLGDCQLIMASREQLMRLMDLADSWEELQEQERMTLLLDLARMALGLHEVRSLINEMPINALDIVEAWLSGQRVVEMVDAGLAIAFDGDSARLSRFLEDVCVFGLSWAIGAFVSFARHELETEDGDLSVGTTLLPAMFKIGVKDPLAAIIAPYVRGDRRLAMEVAAICPFDMNAMDRVIAWLHGANEAELVSLGLDAESAMVLTRKRRTFRDPLADWDGSDTTPKWSFVIRVDDALEDQVPLVLRRTPEDGNGAFQLISIGRGRIGRYRLRDGSPPEWIDDALRVRVSIERRPSTTAQLRYRVVAVRLGPED